MTRDLSQGWESVAAQFMAQRRAIGIGMVRDWAKSLPPGASILDVGCGFGEPIASTLAAMGFRISGIEPSPSLAREFHRRLPQARLACEAAEASSFFGEAFDGALSIGVLFLLPAETQAYVIGRVARALRTAGRFLFTAPELACDWRDSLTGRSSLSLGADAYARALADAGMMLAATARDEGGNFYFDAVKL